MLPTSVRSQDRCPGMKNSACVVGFLLWFALFSAHQQIHAQSKPLLLFGGEDHKTFLGCLNCSKTSDVSVCNEFGKFGSKFNSESIWNKFGDFGSKFNEHSPWNKFSDSAPIIVDKDGNSYGYFSSNKFHHDRTHIGWLVEVLDFQAENDDLEATHDAMCGD